MKLLPLTQGKFAIVDDEDFEWLSQWKWQTVKPSSKSSILYAGRNPGRGGQSKYVAMHRLILKARKGVRVDHRDGNGLNNQRGNLRLATVSQNGMNSKVSDSNTSGQKGVGWYKRVKRWKARIVVRKKEIWLGYFEKKEDAVRVRKEAEAIYFGEFSRLNTTSA